MNEGFKLLAKGLFTQGLHALGQHRLWADDKGSLEGPFFLGFPDVEGWGEGLLIASMLKRYVVSCDCPAHVFAPPQVASVLRDDPAFSITPIDKFSDATLLGARSPLAILRSALTGNLLDRPFVRIHVNATSAPTERRRHRVGVAWASVSHEGPIHEKSIPLKEFVQLVRAVDIEAVSFQRGLLEGDRRLLETFFPGRLSIISSPTLNSSDQTTVVQQIRQLDCMITISTTTAHIAACLGVPVILLAAKRAGHQWFWRAQREHGMCFYPDTEIILGSRRANSWWRQCISPARELALAKLSD